METYDQLTQYCPRLGHVVPFRYCRSARNGLPCSSSMYCWESRFNINQFFEMNYNADELAAICAPAQDKVYTIVEIIEKVKKKQ